MSIMVEKPSIEFWQELSGLDKGLWRNAQERERVRLSRAAYEYWRPHGLGSPDLPADLRDVCVWHGQRTGIWQSAVEGILHIKRHIPVPIAFDTVTVQHDTAYRYLVRPNPGKWRPGWVAATTQIELPDINEELKGDINLDDLKTRVEYDYPLPEDQHQALLDHLRQGNSMRSRVLSSEIVKPS